MYTKALYLGTFSAEQAKKVARLHEEANHSGQQTCSIEQVKKPTILGGYEVHCRGEGCLLSSPTPLEVE
jgi:hypothetical protein